ncbi:MAG: restriction endonuclease [Alphaproteobacteria bacterium]|nr:restriction endonuclease [Alphaproteobacteria bacterium]
MSGSEVSSPASEPGRLDDVSTGKAADHPDLVGAHFPAELQDKFEIFSYRNAASILATSFPNHFADIIQALADFSISTTMIRTPGGSKGPIAKYVDTLFTEQDGWRETRISADLQVKLLDAKKTDHVIQEYIRAGFLDGHRIDFLNGRVALDLEWNSKDQTYDRDLYAFSAFYDAGAIDVGVLITRGSSLDNSFFRSLGSVLSKDGSEGTAEVYKKYGASTTWMGKLLYRLDAGRNGGCPVLAIGITPNCVTPD